MNLYLNAKRAAALVGRKPTGINIGRAYELQYQLEAALELLREAKSTITQREAIGPISMADKMFRRKLTEAGIE